MSCAVPALTLLCFFCFKNLVMGVDPKIQIPLNGVSLAPADAGPTLNVGSLVVFFQGIRGQYC